MPETPPCHARLARRAPDRSRPDGPGEVEHRESVIPREADRHPGAAETHPRRSSNLGVDRLPGSRLPAGHGAGQRSLRKRPGIMADAGFRTGFRTGQPFIQLRPAPASGGQPLGNRRQEAKRPSDRSSASLAPHPRPRVHRGRRKGRREPPDATSAPARTSRTPEFITCATPLRPARWRSGRPWR